MRFGRHQIMRQRGRVPDVFHHRHVNLRVRSQKGVAGKLEVAEKRERDDRGADRKPIAHQLAGVLSSCCFAHARFGFNSSDFAMALRASSCWFTLRSAIPSHRYASAFLLFSSMAFRKSAIAKSKPPPSAE